MTPLRFWMAHEQQVDESLPSAAAPLRTFAYRYHVYTRSRVRARTTCVHMCACRARHAVTTTHVFVRFDHSARIRTHKCHGALNCQNLQNKACARARVPLSLRTATAAFLPSTAKTRRHGAAARDSGSRWTWSQRAAAAAAAAGPAPAVFAVAAVASARAAEARPGGGQQHSSVRT
jgi:hypothetical protein